MKRTSRLLIAAIILLFPQCAKKSITDQTGTSTMPRAATASAPGDVVGKVIVGYQGWFAATGDGSPINGWQFQ